MDTFKILMDQHQSMRALLKEMRQSLDPKVRARVVAQLVREFEFHSQLEEAYVYPVLENFEVLRSWSSVLWDGHAAIQSQFKDLRETCADDRVFHTASQVCEETLEDHLSDEETHVYPTARKLIMPEILELIRQRLESAIQRQKTA